MKAIKNDLVVRFSQTNLALRRLLDERKWEDAVHCSIVLNSIVDSLAMIVEVEREKEDWKS